MNLDTIVKIDNTYYEYLKKVLVAPPARKHLTKLEQAMLDGIITVEECFMLEKLSNA